MRLKLIIRTNEISSIFNFYKILISFLSYSSNKLEFVNSSKLNFLSVSKRDRNSKCIQRLTPFTSLFVETIDEGNRLKKKKDNSRLLLTLVTFDLDPK